MKDKTYAAVFCILLLAGTLIQAVAGSAETVRDIDGNVYTTVQIGKQVWMAENLRVTRYNTGEKIPLIADDKAWQKSEEGAFSWYENDTENGKKYGALYNWLAVASGKLCPPGWRVPTDEDWGKLISFLNRKGLGTEALCAACGSTGFNALPGGYRWWRPISGEGSFFEKGAAAYWWSSTPATETYAWGRAIGFEKNRIYRSSFSKGEGLSVRAIKAD